LGCDRLADHPRVTEIQIMARQSPKRLLMGHSPKLQAILEAARKRFRSGAGIPHETFWREVEREIARKRKK
jgi:hypothetical protein